MTSVLLEKDLAICFIPVIHGKRLKTLRLESVTHPRKAKQGVNESEDHSLYRVPLSGVVFEKKISFPTLRKLSNGGLIWR
jgi:hypothetical protein